MWPGRQLPRGPRRSGRAASVVVCDAGVVVCDAGLVVCDAGDEARDGACGRDGEAGGVDGWGVQAAGYRELDVIISGAGRKAAV